MKLKTKKDTGI